MIKRVLITALVVVIAFAAMSANFVSGAVGDIVIIAALALSFGPIRLLRVVFAGLMMLIAGIFKLLTFAGA